MTKTRIGVLAAFLGFATLYIQAQDVQVSAANRTITVTAEDSVEAPAELAIIQIGYRNYARDWRAAYRQNLLQSDATIKAIMSAGVPKENIRTEAVRLSHIEDEETKPAEFKKSTVFLAYQSWTVRVSVPKAQTVVDSAVSAGANDIADVEWSLNDPAALEAKASAAALSRARAIAEQMAKGLGAKLGMLIYASNTAPATKAFGMMAQTETVEVRAEPPSPRLVLFPQPVRRQATVHAVFAIE
jgi:uncharacterized protein YggE